MAALTSYAEKALLDHLLAITAYTRPITVYVALFTTSATTAELLAGTYTHEVSGGSYARQAITMGGTVLATGVSTNTSAVTFTMPATTVGFVVLCDSPSGPNLLMYDQLGSTVTTASGDGLQVAVGNLTASLS
jgi:hypothetical protein